MNGKQLSGENEAATAQPANAVGKARVVVVDDHPIVREGLLRVIDATSDLAVCACAENIPQALAAIEAWKPAIVIVDIALGGQSGLELIKDIKVRLPGLPVLVHSMYDETIYAERCLRAGAKGYVMKQAPTEQVMAAIRLVLRGGIYLSEQMRSRLLSKVARGLTVPPGSEVDELSDRELEVFQLIGEGCTTARIAASLHLSVSTVETHRAHIKEKLKLKNATELVRCAVEWVQRAAR